MKRYLIVSFGAGRHPGAVQSNRVQYFEGSVLKEEDIKRARIDGERDRERARDRQSQRQTEADRGRDRENTCAADFCVMWIK